MYLAVVESETGNVDADQSATDSDQHKATATLVSLVSSACLSLLCIYNNNNNNIIIIVYIIVPVCQNTSEALGEHSVVRTTDGTGSEFLCLSFYQNVTI